LPGLYAAATHYISLSYGEAWDLPMMEAGASGLELVAPWHSAYRTYLEPDTAHLVESREVPTDLPESDENYALFRRARWWKPDEDRAVEIVQAIVDGTAPRKPPPRAWILETFSWDAAARRLLELLSEVKPRQERRRRRLRRASTRPR
jgi:glycosyltransferase involved in cell wall biosynthesis